jgi:putative hydrolase of HD superfamily
VSDEPDAAASRVTQQLTFLLELDKAKSVYRRSYLTTEDRLEDDAQHMWHLALFVLVLAEHAAEPIDVLHTLELVLLHDVVEIDAGDAFIYDEEARLAKEELETAAAERIYALLPPDQRDRFRSVWDEFEARVTPESRFAASVDRLQPLMLNHATSGRSWREHGVVADQVRKVNAGIARGSPALWHAAQALIEDAVAKGYLPDPGP